jgi:CHAT domain-containing protein
MAGKAKACSFCAAVVILAFAVCVGLIRFADMAPKPQDLHSLSVKLIGASQGKRFCEGRLSWRFTHASFAAAIASKVVAAPSRDLVTAEAAIERWARGQNSSEALNALGILAVMRHQTEKAVNVLESAVFTRRNARILSDLSAARLLRAQERNNPFDIVLALNSAEKAIAIDENLQEARFNRALALERLHLLFPAHLAWESYLRLDSGSGWAREAKNHYMLTATPSLARGGLLHEGPLGSSSEEEMQKFIERSPQDARQYIEETVLGLWADAMKRKNWSEAEIALSLARRLGEKLVRFNGENMPSAAVSVIDRAKGDTSALKALVEGHLAYRDGCTLHGRHNSSGAKPIFERASRALVRGGSPIADWASLYLAVGQFESGHFGLAMENLGRIVSRRENIKFPGLLVRAYWVIGLAQLGAGEPAASLSAYQAALSIAQRTHAVEDTAGIHAVLAEIFRYLGEPNQTWNHLEAALAMTPQISNPQRLNAILDEATDACSERGQWVVALAFQDEAVRIARVSAEPVALSHALLQRSRILSHVGDAGGVRANLEEARRALESIPDQRLKERNFADLLIAESELDSSPANAVADLTSALVFYSGPKNHFILGRLYLARAHSELATGDKWHAEIDLRRGIEEVEKQRLKVSGELLQIAFFGTARSLFDEMIRLKSGQPGMAEVAFGYAERDRARSLLDRFEPLSREQRASILRGSEQPMAMRQIRQELPDDVVIVEYSVLPDRLVTWVIHKKFVHQFVQVIDSTSVDLLVSTFCSDLARHATAAELTSASTALHGLLIRPLLGELSQQGKIIFVPDQSLQAVPFVALRNWETGRMLLEDYTLSVAPSTSFVVAAFRRDRDLMSREALTALAVGNPKFQRRLAPELADLPNAEEEAIALATLLPGSEVLTGEQATKAEFLAAAGRHSIIYFGGHAVVNHDFPLLSYLLMAPTSEADPGELYVYELYRAHFKRSRLAILAACSTGGGVASGEGVMSIARSFLAAGVPSVVASLWPIENLSTSKLIHAFYAQLADGKDPATAFRRAQISLLTAPEPGLNSPATWAAFEFLGVIPSALREHIK